MSFGQESFWTDEIVREFRKLWGEGHSTQEIARRLGTSKNSVVGKSFRLELNRRPSPIRPRNPEGKIPPRKQSFLPPLVSTPCPPERLPPAAHVQPPRPIQPPTPIISRRKMACCWPLGEPGTKTFRFCDQPSIAGKPYCSEHAKLADAKLKLADAKLRLRTIAEQQYG